MLTVATQMQPGFVLSVEDEELGVRAGLQDRVLQVYQGCVYMDFDKALLEKDGHGLYVFRSFFDSLVQLQCRVLTYTHTL